MTALANVANYFDDDILVSITRFVQYLVCRFCYRRACAEVLCLVRCLVSTNFVLRTLYKRYAVSRDCVLYSVLVYGYGFSPHI